MAVWVMNCPTWLKIRPWCQMTILLLPAVLELWWNLGCTDFSLKGDYCGGNQAVHSRLILVLLYSEALDS